MQYRQLILIIFGAFLVCGCEQKASNPNLQFDDSRNPYIKSAEEALQSKNYPDAVKNYESALRANSKLAQPHYELGRIYSDRLADPVSAMYHYQKYLVMTQDPEKKQTVQTLLDNEKITFAALAPNSPIQNAEAFARLQSDNANLKKQLEEANALLTHKLSGTNGQSEAIQTTAETGVTQATGTITQTTTAAQAVGSEVAAPQHPKTGEQVAAAVPREKRSYTIKQGDSLWKISSKFYPGDAKNGIERIKEANKDVLPEGKPLKIGTIITIP